jgi:hypothetical protein
MAIWTKDSNTSLGSFEERTTLSIPLPISSGLTPELSVITGTLPPGLRLEDRRIVGTSFEVERSTDFRFVIRATTADSFEDRTFIITINGADEPVWITEEGLLPVGRNQLFFILDNEPLDFQLNAIDPDLPAGDRLEYFIRPGNGVLPPGIQLTTDGRLVGIVEPLLALDKVAGDGTYDNGVFDAVTGGYDFNTLSANGFESYYYDTVLYDTSTKTRIPKKLNRSFEFIVSVSDGEAEVLRKFKIYVVGDDFLRSDNTIIKIANGLFTADNTFVRAPIWVTPGDLGYRRADNYVTIFLDVIDTNTLAGVLSYQLLTTNPDNTKSELPTGMTLDAINGEIAGRVPYQPAVTKEFTFTIRAIRTFSAAETAFTDKTFTVKILGEVDSTITWLSDSNLGTINANFISILRVTAQTTVPGGNLLYTLSSGSLPPGLSLAYDGELIGKVNQFGTVNNPGLTVFDNGTLTLDGNTTTVDKSYTFTVEARDRFNFSATEKTFTIYVQDPNDNLYSNLYIKPFLNQNTRDAYRTFVTNPLIFPPSKIYRPSDPQFGIQKEIRSLVYSGIETKDISYYVAAAAKFHKKRQFKIGGVKKAVAKNPGSNDIIYEVVYLELFDPSESNSGKTRSQFRINHNKIITVDSDQFNDDEATIKYRPIPENTIKSDSDGIKVSDPNDSVRYISNISNMRDSISEIGLTERGFLPLWMRTAQENNIQELGFTLAIPLAYCKPGEGDSIKLNVENQTDFDFKDIDMTIDRYVIDSSLGNSEEQYILFANYQFNV